MNDCEPFLDGNSSLYKKIVLTSQYQTQGALPDLVNGVMFFSEMTSWAESAHLASYQKIRCGIPDFREDIFELSQGGTAQMMAWTYYFLHKAFDQIAPIVSLRLRHELQRRELDAMPLTDPRLSNVWGKTVYRIVLVAKKLEQTGTYRVVVRKR